jgi:hypothetical protein
MIMIRLQSQGDFQRIRRQVRVCYICSEPLNGDEPENRDHVPPKTLFPRSDRGNPLILDTHKRCNGECSTRDEIVGQHLHGLQGREPDERHDRRGLVQVLDQYGQLQTVLPGEHLCLDWEIDRWVRGCHAALYGTPLPRNHVHRYVHPPVPVGTLENDRVQFDRELPQRPMIAKLIRDNRMAGTIDRIVAWNGAFTYETVWQVDDGGRWFCVWAMRIYDWERLGGVGHPAQRGCCGIYWNVAKPLIAARATALRIPIRNRFPLDPFAE